nr:zinc finger, CCHC-type [Tanacetum cinerariifolium]
MAEENAFLVDDIEGGLCVDNTDVRIGGRYNPKELWDSLESKYMAEDSSSKKFLKDFKHTLKHGKDDLSLVQLGSHLRIEESLRAQDSDKGKGKEVARPSMNMTEEGSKKKPKLECWKCGKTGHFKRDCRSGNKKNANAGGSGKGSKDHFQDQGQNLVDAIAWWTDSDATTYVCKYRCWYRKYEPVEDGYVLYMGGFGYYNNGMFMLNLNKVPDDSDSIYMSSSTVVNSSLWHARLGHVHYKRMLEMSKDNLTHAIDENPKKCTTSPYTPQQNDTAERKNRALKEMVNSMLSYSGLSKGFWGEAIAVVRLPDPKRKTLDDKGIDCIFVGYDEHSKAYRFYVIEPNDSISINSIIESRDAIFDENHFSLIPRPKDIIPNVQESQMDDHTDDVPNEISEPRKGKRVWKAKSYGFDFQLCLVERSRDQVGSQYSYCYSIKEDPRTYNEAMQSRDATFWKKAIDDEIRFIMENNTWVLSDLPPGCKPLGCKWIFKRKMKVDGTIEKFKARLVIQGFRQKEGINYFDTYAPVAPFLNGDLDEEVYMKQLEGFVMPGNEHKVFDKTKKFLSSRFSMKDMGEADDILGIKIKRENKGIVITQSHSIEKIFKKFNREDCSPVSTHMDPVKKLKPNIGKLVDQLEYSRAIGYLMYAMTSTRPDIAYPVSKLSRFTSNPSRHHWKAITRVFKYLRGTKNYGLSYVGYPSVLEGYSDASWINHVEDSSSTSGWVFLLGGGVISWASKKQTCITRSTMESEFVALAAAGKEAE